MSEMQDVMNLELLPNEIFIECFEYFNAPEIFYSFDQLNNRFYQLIQTVSLHLNCQYVRKSIFDQFCTKMLSTPEIQTQIRSLHLSNDNTCVSIKRFLSLFSLNEFSHLRSLTLTQVKSNNVEQLQLMLPLLPELNCFHLMDWVIDAKMLLSVVQISQLRILSADSLNSFLTSSDGILSIKNLTISQCSLYEARYLFQRAPMLRYLNFQNFCKNDSSKSEDQCLTSDYAIYLKQLTIDSFYHKFDDLSTLLKQTPNLKSLILCADNNKNMIDACQWEDLITSSLLRLTIFKFKFSSNYEDDIPEKFKQFQSDFWLQEHHWYTEYSFDQNSSHIYTIPYILNTYTLRPHTERYQNQLMNNVNTFDSVSELILYREAILLQNSYYFSNVTSLKLENRVYFKNIDDELLKIEHIDSLKTIVNLSNLRHLTISINCIIIKSSSLILFQLLKETSQLSSITIELRCLSLLFDDDELCKYFNKMIRKLDILSYSYYSFHSSDELEKFCQIFSNLEQLICLINQENDLLFLLNNLPKLSIMKIHLSTSIDRHSFTPWLQDEGRKLKLPIYIESEHEFSQTVRIWIDRNMH